MIWIVIALATAGTVAAATPHADLRMTMAVNPNPVIASQTVEFVGSVTNAGPDMAESVRFNVPGPYPTSFEHISTSTTPTIPCETRTGEVVCMISNFAPGSSVDFKVVLLADPTFYGRGGVLDGAVQVVALGPPVIDPNENNVVSFTLHVLALTALPTTSSIVAAFILLTLAVVGAVRSA